VGIILIVAAFAPKQIEYSDSVQINASPETVWQFTSSLEGLDKWSPWHAKDPEMKQEWTGKSGEPGSKQCWDSQNDQVGAGCQEIKTVEENKHLETILTFTRPRPSEGAATVDLVAKDGGTEVTWGMTGPMPYPTNIMTLMMDMEKMMGPYWTAGLNKLKELAEEAANAPEEDPAEVEGEDAEEEETEEAA
jgi:uncharacterized protein YndB with AHSA1/START domain